jgi:20S proteasome subunit alpha 7
MATIGSGYDLDVESFSPDGRLFQVEYATKAVDNSGTAIAVCCKDGVVIGIEKIVVSRMLVPRTSRRTFAVDESIGLGMAGLAADSRQIVTRARAECQEYKHTFGIPIEGRVLADRIALFMHVYTLYWSLRPFGCSVLLASFTDDGPQLYTIDSSGASWGYHGCAIGKGKRLATTELEKLQFSTLTCREAVTAIAKIIHKVHDDSKDKLWELEMSWVCNESGRKFQLVPANLVEEAESLAKVALAEEEAATGKKQQPGQQPETSQQTSAAMETDT